MEYSNSWLVFTLAIHHFVPIHTLLGQFSVQYTVRMKVFTAATQYKQHLNGIVFEPLNLLK